MYLSAKAQVQIQVHIPLDAGHLAGVGVLPQVKAVVKIRFGVVLCQPEDVVGQLPQVVAKIAQALVEVDRRAVACVAYLLAEGGGALGEDLVVQAIGAGVISRG